jgi:hypothetical protein
LPWNNGSNYVGQRFFGCTPFFFFGNGPLTADELKNVKKFDNKKPIKYVELGDAAKEI